MWTASRVFPAPPLPVSVTSRDSPSDAVTSAISPSRPTKTPGSEGRFVRPPPREGSSRRIRSSSLRSDSPGSRPASASRSDASA